MRWSKTWPTWTPTPTVPATCSRRWPTRTAWCSRTSAAAMPTSRWHTTAASNAQSSCIRTGAPSSGCSRTRSTRATASACWPIRTATRAAMAPAIRAPRCSAPMAACPACWRPNSPATPCSTPCASATTTPPPAAAPSWTRACASMRRHSCTATTRTWAAPWSGRSREARMGDILQCADDAVTLAIDVSAGAAIERIEIRNRMQVLETWRPYTAGTAGTAHPHHLGRLGIPRTRPPERVGRQRHTATATSFERVTPINLWNIDKPLRQDSAQQLSWSALTTGGFGGADILLADAQAGQLKIDTGLVKAEHPDRRHRPAKTVCCHTGGGIAAPDAGVPPAGRQPGAQRAVRATHPPQPRWPKTPCTSASRWPTGTGSGPARPT